MKINKGSIVKQSSNDVESCRSEKVLFQPNMCVFLQYGVKPSTYGLQILLVRFQYLSLVSIKPGFHKANFDHDNDQF